MYMAASSAGSLARPGCLAAWLPGFLAAWLPGYLPAWLPSRLANRSSLFCY